MWKVRHTMAVICLIALTYGIHPATTNAIEPSERPLAVEHAVNIHRFAHLIPISLSPDGKWVAYTVQDIQRARSVDNITAARTGVAGMLTGTDIWLVNTETGEAQRLTSGASDNFFPIWSPDGHYLAFLSDRDGSHQAKLWLWNVARQQLKQVCNLEIRQFGQIQWTPDSRRIIVPIVPTSMSLDEYVRNRTSAGSAHAADSQGPGSTVKIYKSARVTLGSEDSPSSDPWSLDITLRDLASVDAVDGKVSVLVRARRITVFHVAPDGSRVAYSIPKRFAASGSQQILYDLVVLTLSTMQEQVVASEVKIGTFGEFSWSPDSRHLSFCGQGTDRTLDCRIVERDTSSLGHAIRWHQQLLDYASPYPLWDKQGEHIYYLNGGSLWRGGLIEARPLEIARIPKRDIKKVIAQSDELLWTDGGGKSTIVVAHDDAGKQDGFYRVDLTSGESFKLREDGECYTCANIPQQVLATQDGRNLLYFSEDAKHDSNLWIVSSGFKDPRQLTRLNRQFENYEFGEPRLIDWLSDDGERVSGTLLLPSGYAAGERYPLIVVVYGGGHLSDGFDRFGGWFDGPFNMQLLATRGYVVLLPDMPLTVGKPMLDIPKAVLPGINEAIAMGIADPARLGIMGQSYGGYSTLASIVFSQRFKAAVDIDGPADLVSLFGQMNSAGAAYQTGVDLKLRGTPWEHRDDYIENSPIFYLDRITTPLLIVHGAADSAVAASQADEVFVGLRRLGKVVEYARYAGEDHSQLYWSYVNQIDYCQRMIAWFQKYLKGITQ